MITQGGEGRRWLDVFSVGAIALAAGMITSVAIAATTWKDVRTKPTKHSIRVTGSAKRRIVSDQIDWTAALEARAPDRTAAYKELRAERDKAVAFLKAQGIKPEETEVSSTSFQEEFDTREEIKVLPGTNVPMRTEKKISKGFVTKMSIRVRSGDVKRVEKASQEITSLLEEGVSVTSEEPLYIYTHLQGAKVEMLAEAGKDARARAENILRSAGAITLGRLIVADMGIINVNPANSTETSEEGNNDTSSLEKDIITIVHAEFEID
jgi:hypothetical protein